MPALLRHPLVLVHEIPAHLLQIALVRPQLLDLASHVRLATRFADFDLLLVSLPFLTPLTPLTLLTLLPILPPFSREVPERALGARPEVLVPVDVIAFGVTQFLEAVHVELADERGEVAVLEVLGEDVFGELANASDCEGVAFGGPAYGLRVLLVLP